MITVDKDRVVVSVNGERREYSLRSPEAFRILSSLWLMAGWETKYVYSFTWLGRPVIQLPEDLIRLQEVIYGVRPDVIVETGVAHGGSAVFYASLLKAIGRGRVIGVDVEIRPHNRQAIESHELCSLITLVEGDSTAPAVVDRVRSLVAPGERVMVLLDSGHTKRHVLAELEAYAPLVSPGSYAVVADGIMEDLVGASRSQPDWATNNPKAAVEAFARSHPEFAWEEPPFAFNEGSVSERVTYWKNGYLRRIA